MSSYGAPSRSSSHFPRPDPRSSQPPTPQPPRPTAAEVLRDLRNIGAATRDNRFGKQGRPIDVKVNCFPVDISALTQLVTHYDLTFEEIEQEDQGGARGGRGGRGRGRGSRGRGRGRNERPKPAEERPLPIGIATKLVRNIESENKFQFGGCKIAHDGRKNAYTTHHPNWESNRKTFQAQWEGKKYKVTFTVANQVNMGELAQFINKDLTDVPQEAITVLDIVLRTSPLREWIYTGKTFAVQPSGDTQNRLGQGCEAWVCYYQAFRPKENGMFLSFDVNFSAFYTSQTVYDFAAEILASTLEPSQDRTSDAALRGPLNKQQIAHLENELRGIKVEQLYLQESERKPELIKRLTLQPATQLEFESSNQRMSVANHFEDMGQTLSYPDMPCIDISSGRSHVYIPLEKARIITGQRRRKMLTGEMKERLAHIAAQSPLSRMSKINNVLEDVNESTKEYLGAFGVKVNMNKLSIRARVLEPPKIILGQDVSLDLASNSEHEFSWSMKDRKVFQPGQPLRSWGVLVLAQSVQKFDVKQFVYAVIHVLRGFGLEVLQPRIKYSHTPVLVKDMISLKQEIDNDPDTPECQMIMVIKENTATRDYNKIKNVSDTYLGIPSQCVVAGQVKQPTLLYCLNLCMKINAKLGGVTARIPGDHFACLGDRFLVVGATVSHASGLEQTGDVPSISAMVGSLDKRCGRHGGTIRVQDAAAEGIRFFGSMFGQILEQFYALEQFLPENILIYRNGVADGQFPRVLREELNSARERAAEFGQQQGIMDYQPKMTLIVMQRGHHMRFFPLEDGPEDRSHNCIPGTVIDTDVSHPQHYDFYMISHNGIQGTSRPMRYTVLKDDIGLGPDDIQGLTYRLCYLFTRSSRSVSMVPAVYYSDLLAARGRAFLAARNTGRFEVIPGQPSISSEDPLPAEFTSGQLPAIHKNLTKRFFYV